MAVSLLSLPQSHRLVLWPLSVQRWKHKVRREWMSEWYLRRHFLHLVKFSMEMWFKMVGWSVWNACSARNRRHHSDLYSRASLPWGERLVLFSLLPFEGRECLSKDASRAGKPNGRQAIFSANLRKKGHHHLTWYFRHSKRMQTEVKITFLAFFERTTFL